jgi:thiol-disulfide isomerase/thioredoxin
MNEHSRSHPGLLPRTRTAIIQSGCASYWRENESRSLAGAIVVKMVVRPQSRPVWGALGAGVLAAAVMVMVACGRAAPPPAEPRSHPPRLLPSNRLELPQYSFAQFEALLAELRGRPVVVNIWGSWCPPCVVEASELAEVSREFEGRVQFVGVDILDDRRAARDFILRFDWPYPSVFDPDGEIRDRLGFFGQPITVIYDRSSDVAFEWAGTVTADLLREEILKVLED